MIAPPETSDASATTKGVRPCRVLFVGGGTAGHLAPGFALSDALQALGVETLFATPGEGRETAWFAGRPPPIRLPASRIPRTWMGKAGFPARFLTQTIRCGRSLGRLEVDCVVALGGWPCAAPALAASRAGIPLVFVAVDAVPGRVVRWLGKRADRIYVAHESTRDILALGARVVVTGPLIDTDRLACQPDTAAFGLSSTKRTLLVTGGSLGALTLNRRVVAGLEHALSQDASLIDRLQVIHQVGGEDKETEAHYQRLGIQHFVRPFLSDASDQSMGAAYAVADLALARGGANTVGELIATVTPAVVVPYPFHTDRQQHRNAEMPVAAGGAILVEQADLSPDRIADEIVPLLLDENQTGVMRAALEALQANRTYKDAEKCDVASETARDLIRFLDMGPEPTGKPKQLAQHASGSGATNVG